MKAVRCGRPPRESESSRCFVVLWIRVLVVVLVGYLRLELESEMMRLDVSLCDTCLEDDGESSEK